jgi:hypothetical protein
LSDEEITIAPAKITKYAGNRYHIEIPQSMLYIAEQLHGAPVIVKIKALSTRKHPNEPVKLAHLDSMLRDAAGEAIVVNHKDYDQFMRKLVKKYGDDLTSENIVNETNEFLRCFREEKKKEIKRSA